MDVPGGGRLWRQPALTNKPTDRQSFGFHSLTWRLVAWILGSVGLVYLGTLLYSDSLARDLIVAAAESEAVNVTRAYVKDIQNGLRSIEERTELLAEVVGTVSPRQEELDEILRTFVSRSDVIYGSTVAFAPSSFQPDVQYFAPYYYQDGDEVAYKDLAADSYRYWEWDWYTAVASSKEPRWSEPYVDEGGGNVRMVTYSVPFFLRGNESQELRGVVTADISLGWLHEQMKTLQVGETGYGAILSKGGYVVSHPDETLLRHQTVAELEERGPTPEVVAIVERMMRGESGFEPIHDRRLGKPARMTYAPIGHAGWVSRGDLPGRRAHGGRQLRHTETVDSIGNGPAATRRGRDRAFQTNDETDQGARRQRWTDRDRRLGSRAADFAIGG